jgi:hypothetical protein
VTDETAPPTVRAHVVLPTDLVSSVDRLVGRRGRSRFVTEAVAEKLARLRRETVLRGAAGALGGRDLPEWEDAAAWVGRSRDGDVARERALRGTGNVGGATRTAGRGGEPGRGEGDAGA